MECFVERLKQIIPALHKAAASFLRGAVVYAASDRSNGEQPIRRSCTEVCTQSVQASVLSNPDIQAVDLMLSAVPSKPPEFEGQLFCNRARSCCRGV